MNISCHLYRYSQYHSVDCGFKTVSRERDKLLNGATRRASIGHERST